MRLKKITFLGFVITLLIFLLFVGFSQATMRIDPTYGDDGFVLSDFGIGDDEAFGLAVQDDGKVVVAGYSKNGAVKNLAVVRYLSNGDLDTEFNHDGMFTLSLGTGDTLARSLVLQNDGKIVVAGSAYDGEDKIAVIRLTPEGNLDNSFATNGRLLLPVEEGEVKTGEVQIAVDGTIVMAGTIGSDPSTNHSFFAKFNSFGELDEGFGSDGIALIKKTYGIGINTFALLEGGKILAGGTIVTDFIPEAGLLRLNENGTIDDSFGINGESILVTEGRGSAVTDVLVDKSGVALMVGYADNGKHLEAFVGAVDEKGLLVSSFGTSGVYRSSLLFENVANGIALQDDGSILVAGFATEENSKDIFIMTVDGTYSSQNNSPEMSVQSDELLKAVSDATELSQDGAVQQPSQSATLQSTYLTTDIASYDDTGYAISVLPDGKVVAVGSSTIGNDKDFAVLRYENGDTAKSSSAENGTAGVVSNGYYILTTPVGNITRVGALSGGTIAEASGQSCKTGCTEECKTTEGEVDSVCVTTCEAACESAVGIRGVVFSVNTLPVYSEGEPEEPTPEPSDGDGGVFPNVNTSSSYLVRSGQTEDGEGLGVYSSDVQEITPETKYYLRAYAVLSDGKVIYGNQVMFKTKDACFIATATYGSILDNHVVILREFRDRIMKTTKVGQQLVGMYYHYSPKLAGMIEQNEFLRAIVRIILLPFVLFAFLVLKTTVVTKLCLLVAFVSSVAMLLKIFKKTQVTPI